MQLPAIRCSRVRRILPWLLVGMTPWVSSCDGRLPAPLVNRTVDRTLYFKLPIAGTRFHWRFLDRRAFLSGELTLRIINRREKRDQTLVIARAGRISDGWAEVDDIPRDSSVYFGFSTDRRVPTAPDDSIIITLTTPTDLRGIGPYSQGTLARGTWVASGVYTDLYGGTFNPVKDLVMLGQPPVAFASCWDTAWTLRDGQDVGWMGVKPKDEDDTTLARRFGQTRGVDGRVCRTAQ